MILPRQSADGPDEGKWYMMAVEAKVARRIGYCATGCDGHETKEDALDHYLRFQLDRESDLWLDRRSTPLECEICGDTTTLRARLGRNSKLFVLCGKHQSTSSLQELFRRRATQPVAEDA
ncbi:MAG: hypothetical protein ACT4O5_09765 [Gammaproteobacteria bacterium]